MKFRQHRGSLANSMETTREIEGTRQALVAEITRAFDGIDAAHIVVKPYGYDERIGWDTHIVTLEGYGVLGFTD